MCDLSTDLILSAWALFLCLVRRCPASKFSAGCCRKLYVIYYLLRKWLGRGKIFAVYIICRMTQLLTATLSVEYGGGFIYLSLIFFAIYYLTTWLCTKFRINVFYWPITCGFCLFWLCSLLKLYWCSRRKLCRQRIQFLLSSGWFSPVASPDVPDLVDVIKFWFLIWKFTYNFSGYLHFWRTLCSLRQDEIYNHYYMRWL